jgi:hypothetical protein
MLVVEKTSNGRTIVRVQRDWHPNRIGIAYTHPRRTLQSKAEYRLQAALLRKNHD